MGLLDDAEKLAGAVAAVEAAKKLDPNAGLFTEGAAAVAGYEGVAKIKEEIEKKKEEEGAS